MNNSKNTPYSRLYEAYKKAYQTTKTKQRLQDETNTLWASLKSGPNVEKAVDEEIEKLNRITTNTKAKFLSFFTSLPSTSKSSCENAAPPKSPSFPQQENIIQDYDDKEKEIPGNFLKKPREKPSQELSQKKVTILESELNSLVLARESGLGRDDTNSKIDNLKKTLTKEKQNLKRKQDDAERQQKCRDLKKRGMTEILKENPDLAAKLKIRSGVGRPRIENDNPNLLKVISEIAVFGGAAEDRRRSEMIRSCHTLDDLLEELQKRGFTVSRSALYLRLLPKRSTTIEGKRHVVTVPVKLSRPEANQHAKHPDGELCTATMRGLETLASVLGPDQVFFFSKDDKSRVPLGITAANKQAPILMHLDYEIRLPDHDFVVAERHKLIPSVYAGIEIAKDGEGQPTAVSYSGPTYIAIRSGKHCSSSAETHAADLERLVELPIFEPLVKTPENMVKPIFFCTSDGGPDENPRYSRVIASAVEHFRKYDLDAYYLATNAPGRSAYNRVERRMAPLSRELTGLILEHQHFGSHLNSKNETVDVDLEKRNFEHAGQVLSEVWNGIQIDNFPVDAEYVGPEEHPVASLTVDEEWYLKHVRESQYFLQIVKCDSENCCGRRRSSLWNLLPDGFVPPPVVIQQTSEGYTAVENSEISGKKYCPLLLQLALKLRPHTNEYEMDPYDYYCPSLQSSIKKRVCEVCGIYRASNKAIMKHKQQMHKKQKTTLPEKKIRPIRVVARRAKELLCIFNKNNSGVEDAAWIDEEEIDDQSIPEFPEINYLEGMPVISSIEEWCHPVWQTENLKH